MNDGTRTDRDDVEGAAAFAAFVLDWLEEFGRLVDALVVLRRRANASTLCDGLLAAPELQRFRESWELWEAYADIDQAEADERLAPHLTAAGVRRLRLAVWGLEPVGEG